MNQIQQGFPVEDWSDDLQREVKRAIRWRRIMFWWTIPFDAIAERFFRRSEERAWDERHYHDWSRQELLWRIMFLQGAGRTAWAERETWRLVVCPIGIVLAFALGLWLGVRS
jgi:hypothetical protein